MIPAAGPFGFTCLLALIAFATTAHADCASEDFDGADFTLCVIDPAKEDLRLFLADAEGEAFGTFQRLDQKLGASGLTLEIAMNGGMYHDDLTPVGHYVENGVEQMRLITSAGPGNFGLLPNGVFCLAGKEAMILETTAFKDAAIDCDFATQSGPMLVISGLLHPRFLPDSASEHIRNGVGVTGHGRVVMAISNEPVNFHHFARFFRDHIGAPDALFIDGKVSRLYAPSFGRSDIGFPMGPILGTVVPRN